MSTVFASVTMSLDGFIAPEWQSDDQWMEQWSELQAYVLRQRFFLQNLHLGETGETGRDNEVLEQTFERTGASIMGKRMFDAGERPWPEDAPFHTPVFVLTHQVREPWPRKGGTTFYFVNDGIESALEQARNAAGPRDVRIAGGAHAIAQYLNAGLLDELDVALAPVLLGCGTKLFDRVANDRIRLEIKEVVNSPDVTHLRYDVRRR